MALGKVFRVDGLPSTFFVPSSTREGVGYLVRLTPFPACTCPGFRYNGRCKHILMVEKYLGLGGKEDGASQDLREAGEEA